MGEKGLAATAGNSAGPHIDPISATSAAQQGGGEDLIVPKLEANPLDTVSSSFLDAPETSSGEKGQAAGVAAGGSAGDLTQLQADRLQQLQDQRSRLSQEVSNAAKKAADSDQAIADNIK